MIGRLRGILSHKQPPWLIIDVGGVGYELEAPMSTEVTRSSRSAQASAIWASD